MLAHIARWCKQVLARCEGQANAPAVARLWLPAPARACATNSTAAAPTTRPCTPNAPPPSASMPKPSPWVSSASSAQSALDHQP